MTTHSQTIEDKSPVANLADYARLDFPAFITPKQAEKFGGEILSDECVTMRMAAIILTKSKQELIDGIGQDKELLMTTIEKLQDLEAFIRGALIEMSEKAIIRLLSVAASITAEEGETIHEKGN